jgi:hypothetical protein
MAVAMVYFGAVIFDATYKMQIEPYFMQPADLSSARVGRPVPIEKLSDEFIRDRLIKKFVIEYFYVIPDSENVNERIESGAISRMGTPAVFREWKENVAPGLARLADDNVLRRVIVRDNIRKGGDYYVVEYDLITYDRPNDTNAVPEIKKNNEIRLRLALFEKKIWEDSDAAIVKYLESGGDPSAIFKFKVDEVR